MADDPTPDAQPEAPEPEAPAAEAAQADQDMSDLVNQAIAKGIPSYEAWASTPDELAKRLEN